MRRVAIALLCGALPLGGCVTYAGFPEGYDKPAAKAASSPRTLHYMIEGSAMFAGPNAIRSVLLTEAPYEKVVAAEKPVTTGDQLSVKITQNPPSVAAVTFGYISVATLTLLPFWSTNDGSTLLFTLYRNGKPAATREYVIQRRSFVWILMAPVAWVNFMTPSEDQTFAAATRDFLAVAAGKSPAPLRSP